MIYIKCCCVVFTAFDFFSCYFVFCFFFSKSQPKVKLIPLCLYQHCLTAETTTQLTCAWKRNANVIWQMRGKMSWSWTSLTCALLAWDRSRNQLPVPASNSQFQHPTPISQFGIGPPRLWTPRRQSHRFYEWLWFSSSWWRNRWAPSFTIELRCTLPHTHMPKCIHQRYTLGQIRKMLGFTDAEDSLRPSFTNHRPSFWQQQSKSATAEDESESEFLQSLNVHF